MTTLFGIKNCDTIKKARKWLEQNKIDYQFHDYRSDGLDVSWLEQAEQALGWEVMLNKRGTTFRQLPDEQKDNLDREKAMQLMLAHPAMIKRPILQRDADFTVGFKDAQYQDLFA